MTSFTFDGREIAYTAGQTVAAALIANGVLSWRTTRKNDKPRGVFCGIGVCFDCLITIDGTPNQRACLVPADAGMSVAGQRGTGRQ